MSESPTYWSQPNQQVVRDGDPVGIMDSGPDPQVEIETKAKGKGKSTDDEPELEPEHKAKK
jgi:hypothetical protein